MTLRTPNRRAYRRIGEVARETGLTPRAIRHYESLGLLRPAARVDGGNRLYDDLDLERLREIRRLRDGLGFSLAEIGEMIESEAEREQIRADLAATLDPTERRTLYARLHALAARRLAIIDTKIAHLHELRQQEAHRLERLAERLHDLAES